MGARRSAAIHGAAVASIVVGLITYWFAVADRYAVFLYGHVDRSGDPPAAPFDGTTVSRYWMSGLVAGGVVMVLYTAAVLLARNRSKLRASAADPPTWWQVWSWAAPLVAVGVPVATLTQNGPTLPLPLAASVTGSALVGLTLALLPAAWAWRRPGELLWLALDGLGLTPLLLVRALELPNRHMMEGVTAVLIAAAGIGGSALWLGVVTVARARSGREAPTAPQLVASAACWVFLATPLSHYLLFTPSAYRYITSSANVFGYEPTTSAATALVAVAMAVGVTRWRDCAAALDRQGTMAIGAQRLDPPPSRP